MCPAGKITGFEEREDWSSTRARSDGRMRGGDLSVSFSLCGTRNGASDRDSDRQRERDGERDTRTETDRERRSERWLRPRPRGSHARGERQAEDAPGHRCQPHEFS